MNTQILNRFKSFGWRTLMMCLVILADYVINNLTGFGLPAVVTIVVGLIAGEVSKFVNQLLSETPDLSTISVPKKVAKKKKK
jgi:hypothetical protein